MCVKCKIIRRRGRVAVICENPKDKYGTYSWHKHS